MTETVCTVTNVTSINPVPNPINQCLGQVLLVSCTVCVIHFLESVLCSIYGFVEPWASFNGLFRFEAPLHLLLGEGSDPMGCGMMAFKNSQPTGQSRTAIYCLLPAPLLIDDPYHIPGTCNDNTEYRNCEQRGLRRGGLTPALAPRMPVITEDVGKSRP